MCDLSAGRLVELFHGKMRKRAIACGAVVELTWLRLSQGNKVSDCICRYVGIDDENCRHPY
jgi:hypothetical protein